MCTVSSLSWMCNVDMQWSLASTFNYMYQDICQNQCITLLLLHVLWCTYMYMYLLRGGTALLVCMWSAELHSPPWLWPLSEYSPTQEIPIAVTSVAKCTLKFNALNKSMMIVVLYITQIGFGLSLSLCMWFLPSKVWAHPLLSWYEWARQTHFCNLFAGPQEAWTLQTDNKQQNEAVLSLVNRQQVRHYCWLKIIYSWSFD